MHLVAEMLLKHLQTTNADAVQAARVCPPMVRRLSRLPLFGKKPIARNSSDCRAGVGSRRLRKVSKSWHVTTVRYGGSTWTSCP